MNNEIKVLNLHGSKFEMGRDYGIKLKTELEASLEILKDFFVVKNGVVYDKLAKKSQIFFDKYPYGYQKFIEGMAQGSGLSLEECKILNGMETLFSLLREKQEITACSFIGVPESRTNTDSTLVGRNYDFPAPYDAISKYLTVTVLHEPDTIPSAIIGLPGQIYCPSCVNSEGLFVELNNGMPSGGYFVDHSRESLLINLLEAIQNSANFQQLDKQLLALNSDYSLIINTAGPNDIKSYEFSSSQGLKSHSPAADDIYVSTNYYQNPAWEKLPEPTDESTWQGVTRRQNLEKQNVDDESIDIAEIMDRLDSQIHEGGSKWDMTIYQIAFDTGSNELYLKRPTHEENWNKIPLKEYFTEVSSNAANTEL